MLLVAEHSPPNKSRGFWSSWPQAAVPVGNLLATAVLFTMSTVLSSEAFLGWGWRVAFWLSAVIVFVGYYIRTHVTEAPPIFLEAKAQVKSPRPSATASAKSSASTPRASSRPWASASQRTSCTTSW